MRIKKYYHIMDELETGVIPLHIHVESEITKGKYGDYDTFIGQEAVQYLNAYLDYRRHGSISGKIPPEEITLERPHSIRKFFRTQMTALGVDRDYIEYMMGHKVSTYHDIQMKGIEFLRNVYAATGLSIRPKTRLGKIEALKEIIRAWGMNPEEILTRKALAMPHRTSSRQPNEKSRKSGSLGKH